MIIGIPKEIKAQEYRVALTPSGVAQLLKQGHRVFVEKSAGLGSGFSDNDYRHHGAVVLPDAKKLWATAELILKVKEPLPKEYAYFRPRLILFTYLHLASVPELAKALMKKKVEAIGYETVVDSGGALPLLRPMSQVAGKLAVMLGADFLRKDRGNKGVLLSSLAGARSGRVIILGAGNVGQAALQIALGLGSQVTLFDKDEKKLEQVRKLYPSSSLQTHPFNSQILEQELKISDLLIGAVLIPGARAPKLVTRHMVALMEKGSVIVDVSIDQGACVETMKATTHAKPVFDYKGILHYAVPNMPSLVSRSSTEALTAATLPYVLKLADHGLEALKQDVGFAKGLQINAGEIVHEGVKGSLTRRSL
ncbi:MAG: alanine dehydrogenase [Deltaproteobacteria bacterium]|nr:alanine dehydrogenase [Deltaproteobacteria bacterium]